MNLFDLAKHISPAYSAKFWRAIIEFNLIQENDRIAVGFSGGKDSIFLLYLMNLLQKRFPFPFSFEAIHIDNGFANKEARHQISTQLSSYCKDLNVPLTIHSLPMEEIWKEKQEKNPCFICAKYRRGALAKLTIEKGFNKIALAHHQDDAVETFMLNLFQSGQIKTFTPSSYMDRTNLEVIRPLIFMREKEIIEATTHLPWIPIKNPCPHDSITQRAIIRNWIKNQENTFPGLFDKLSRSLREDQVKDLWPPLPDRKELKNKFEIFWKKPSR